MSTDTPPPPDPAARAASNATAHSDRDAASRPNDARLAARWAAFERGDFRSASEALPLDGLDADEKRRYEAPLRRALRFEPWLVAMAGAGAAFWIAIFAWAQ